MALPSSVFTEMVVTTLRNRTGKVTDAVSEHNAFYRRLKEKGKVTKDGGRELVYEIDYNQNTNYVRYSGYDTVPIESQTVLTAAKYDWVQAAITVTASGRELRMNRGKEAMIKLVKARIKNAMNTVANQMSIDLYSTGSLSNQIGGLAHLIQEDGNGTVGGINASTWSFWRNKFLELTGNASASTIRADMNTLDLLTTRGSDTVDLIIASHDLWSLYWTSLDDYQRYAGSPTTAGSRTTSLKFKNADVIFDNNANFLTNAEKMFFINTDYMEFVEHPDARWTPEDKRMSVNQDAEVVPMFWMGQLCCSNRARQGVLIDNTDS